MRSGQCLYIFLLNILFHSLFTEDVEVIDGQKLEQRQEKFLGFSMLVSFFLFFGSELFNLLLFCCFEILLLVVEGRVIRVQKAQISFSFDDHHPQEGFSPSPTHQYPIMVFIWTTYCFGAHLPPPQSHHTIWIVLFTRTQYHSHGQQHGFCSSLTLGIIQHRIDKIDPLHLVKLHYN